MAIHTILVKDCTGSLFRFRGELSREPHEMEASGECGGCGCTPCVGPCFLPYQPSDTWNINLLSGGCNFVKAIRFPFLIDYVTGRFEPVDPKNPDAIRIRIMDRARGVRELAGPVIRMFESAYRVMGYQLPEPPARRGKRSDVGCDSPRYMATRFHAWTRSLSQTVKWAGDPFMFLWIFLKYGMGPSDGDLARYCDDAMKVVMAFGRPEVSAALAGCPRFRPITELKPGKMMRGMYEIVFRHIPDVGVDNPGARHETIGLPAFVVEDPDRFYSCVGYRKFLDVLIESYELAKFTGWLKVTTPVILRQQAFIRSMLKSNKKCPCCSWDPVYGRGLGNVSTREARVLCEWLSFGPAVYMEGESKGIMPCYHTTDSDVQYKIVRDAIRNVLNHPEVQVHFGTLSGRWVGEGRKELQCLIAAPSTHCAGYWDGGPACSEMGMLLR